MPRAIQSQLGFATVAAAGLSVVTPAPGDTFAVATFAPSSSAAIAQLHATGAVTDFVRVRSPRLHDANQGLRIFIGATTRRRLLPWELYEQLYPADVPIVEIDQTAAGTGALLATYEYADLPGVQPRLAMPSEVLPRMIHTMGCEVDVTSGAIGAWGNGVAINANFDNFEAGADYALLGYTCNVGSAGIAITGKDTGNLKIGMPGDPDPFQTQDYFVTASERSNAPFIPVIAANNKGSTLLQNVDVAAATVQKVTLLLAQLA